MAILLRGGSRFDAVRRSRGPGALILGGAHGSLAVARSLGRRGVPVIYLTHDNPLAGFSRYVLAHGAWPGPNHPKAAAWLIDFATEWGLAGWVLFAGGDQEVELVARHHHTLASVFRLTTPPWSTARWALDKRLTHQHAAAVGVDSPASFYPSGRDDLIRAGCSFPVILKPMVRTSRNVFTDAKAWRADDLVTLLARYDEASALMEPGAIAVQELIPGGGEAQFSYAALWSNGAPTASLVARRTRQYPVDFGFTSTYVETVDRPDIEAAAQQFLSPLAFSGLVEIEFKCDPRDGRRKLLDVNMRTWTWIALATAAGLDFPFLQWELAQGRAIEPVGRRRAAAWTYASRDLAASLRLCASGTLSLRSYLRSLTRPRAFAAFAADDPLPGLVDLPLAALRVIARRLARLRPPRKGLRSRHDLSRRARAAPP